MRLTLLMLYLVVPLHAQALDSLAVVLPMPKDSATEAVVAAFSAAGLPVSDQGPGFVTADLGEMTGTGYGTSQLIVRAVIFTTAGRTTVILRGESREAAGGFRLTSKMKGKYGKAWKQMQSVAMRLGG